MRFKDINRHLKPYSIVANRTTTINHAFAAAIAPCDQYDEGAVRAAIKLLGQDPEADLICVYCGVPAETWDHVHATVQNKAFSGFRHRVGNLLPCCKPCNSKKENREWSDYLEQIGLPAEVLAARKTRIAEYLSRYSTADAVPEHLPEYQELLAVRRQVLDLFARADALAAQVREKGRAI